MFGFGLKSKAKRVIKEEFFYEVSYMYGPLFNNFVQQGKMLGQNEYSIAIMYMTVMMNVLVENQTDDKSQIFGRSEHMTSVKFDGSKNDIGKIVPVKIKSSNRTTLFGEAIESSNEKVA